MLFHNNKVIKATTIVWSKDHVSDILSFLAPSSLSLVSNLNYGSPNHTRFFTFRIRLLLICGSVAGINRFRTIFREHRQIPRKSSFLSFSNRTKSILKEKQK